MQGSCLKFDNPEDLKILLEETNQGEVIKIYTSSGRLIEFSPASEKNDSKELEDFFHPIFSDTGLYLKPPHGHLIVSGKKTLIAKSVNLTSHINKPLYLLSGDYACGIIELGSPRKVSLKEFKKLFEEHRISEPERLGWWPDVTEFYLYSVKLIREWPVFRKWKRTDSTRSFINNVQFIDSDKQKEDEPTRVESVIKEIDRIGDWYMVRETQKKHRYVAQHHIRGTSVHTDLRIEADGHLIGWTLDTPGKVGAKSKFLNPVSPSQGFDFQILSQRKLMQPKVWLKVKGKIPPGGIGATPNKPAEFIIMSRGTAKFGTQKTDFHEYFLEPDGNGEFDKKIEGRWITARIKRPKHFKKAGEGLTMWATWKPNEQAQYIDTHDFEKEKEKAIKDEIDMIWQNKNGKEKQEVAGITDLKKSAKHFF